MAAGDSGGRVHRVVTIITPPPVTEALVAQCTCIAASFRRWTGRNLVGDPSPAHDLVARLFDAPFVLLAHGTEADPVLTYGNRMALTLWETTWERFTRMPSRLTAEPQARDDRARALAEVARRGFVEDYRGVRVSGTGRRFLIERAVVWSLVDPAGRVAGQAAMFDAWTDLG